MRGFFLFLEMAKSKIKKVQFKRECIFCSGSPLSEQHCIPNWIEKEFPEGRIHHNNFRATAINSNGTIYLTPETIYRQGRLGVKRLKIVCEKCNNHWMSIIENEAKPIVIKLVNNEQYMLTLKEREIIATWMMLVTIIFENDQPNTKAVDKAERDFLYQNLMPTDNWEFYLGKSDEDERFKRRLFHQGFQLEPKETVKSGNVGRKCNYQLTLLGINGMVLMARYLRSDRIKLSTDDIINKNFIKIWPLKIDGDLGIDNTLISFEIIEKVIVDLPEVTSLTGEKQTIGFTY